MEFAVITGATGGLGKEFTKKLIERGNNVFLIGRSEEKLFLLKQELSFKYNSAVIEYKKCDLTSEIERENFYSEFKKCGYKVSGLYFVAGADIRKAFIKYSDDATVFQARVNFEACLSFTNFALKNKNEKLKILAVSSLTGITPMPYFAEYSSLKGALISFYTALRYELKNSGTKITVLAPGSIPTRSDIKEDILNQGLQGRLSSKSPAYVVEQSLKALDKNKRICIPGFYNKFIYFISKITPNGIKSVIIANKFKNLEKDAFTTE